MRRVRLTDQGLDPAMLDWNTGVSAVAYVGRIAAELGTTAQDTTQDGSP